jgi:hypothetical protein
VHRRPLDDAELAALALTLRPESILYPLGVAKLRTVAEVLEAERVRFRKLRGRRSKSTDAHKKIEREVARLKQLAPKALLPALTSQRPIRSSGAVATTAAHDGGWETELAMP